MTATQNWINPHICPLMEMIIMVRIQGWAPKPSFIPFQLFTPTFYNYDQTEREDMASTSFDYFFPAQTRTPSESIFSILPRQLLDNLSSRFNLSFLDFPKLFSSTPYLGYSGDFNFTIQNSIVEKSSDSRYQSHNLNLFMQIIMLKILMRVNKSHRFKILL